MIGAHGGNVVEAQERQAQQGLSLQLIPLPPGKVGAKGHAALKQCVIPPHFRDVPAVKEQQHEYQKRPRMAQLTFLRAIGHPAAHQRQPLGAETQAPVLSHCPQEIIPPAGLFITLCGKTALSRPLIPRSQAGKRGVLLRLRQQCVLLPGAGAQHIVIAIHTVGTGDEGVLRRQAVKKRSRISVRPEICRRLHSEIVRHAQTYQKRLLTLRQGAQQRFVDEWIDAGRVFRPASLLLIGFQIQIHHGKPPLGGFRQVRCRVLSQMQAAAAGVGTNSGFTQPQIIRIHFPQPRPQAQPVRLIKNHVPAQQHQMDAIR